MNKIPVVLACDGKVAFSVATVLVSMAENAHETTFYEIYILYAKDVEEESRQKIKALENRYGCLAINFINMGTTFANIKKTHEYVNYVSAYKMKIPSLTKQYSKILYLDCDVIVRDDLSELYATDIGDNYILGVPAIFNQIVCREAIKNIIKVDMDYYVNAGVLLFNNDLILKDKIDDKCISMLGSFEGSVDQHIFNHVCYGRIGFLPLKYNVFLSDYDLYEKYGNIFASQREALEAKANPVIMHFTMKTKPWDYYNLPFAHEWFCYYRKTGFPDRVRKKVPDEKKILKKVYFFGIPLFRIISKGDSLICYVLGIKILSVKQKLYYI